LKQTNFIDRLVEDTLADNNDATVTIPTMTFQPAKQQQVDTSYSEDTSSQFSHLNESLDEKRT